MMSVSKGKLKQVKPKLKRLDLQLNGMHFLKILASMRSQVCLQGLGEPWGQNDESDSVERRTEMGL